MRATEHTTDDTTGLTSEPTSGPTTTRSRQAIVADYERHLGRAAARLADQTRQPVEVRSEGALVWDEEDRSYLDCGGYGVFILGHRHPAVLDAVRRQLDRHPLATRSLLSGELADAARRLAAVTPAGLERVYFACTGAEAVEAALKLARAGGRRRVIAMANGFHGKTLGALSVTDRLAFQAPFRPLLPDITTVPFGDAEALREALADGGGKACVILEPVQGEGGVRIPPAGYLREVADACGEAGAMLILDEVQSGLGRLGTWWGCDAEDVRPDLLLTGKGLGGGCLPVSAVVATEAAFAPLDRNPRLHSSTFSGYPLGMAAVTATLETIERDDVPARAQLLGKRLYEHVVEASQAAGPELVREVRGRGLLIGVELSHPRVAGRFMRELLARRVIAAHSLGTDTVVRFTPPATLTESEIDWFVNAVGEAMTRLGDTEEAAP
ncbi:aspartate aminotransferase family protein [Spirillospora sp. NPDC048911]|uniref:aspartate aminotransferase family protein n=1 Tax=Spirillospora sp. NPDC048911 TaxID=3364527 RepID=UPI003722C60B